MVTVSPRNRRRTRLAAASALVTTLLAAACLHAPAASAAGTRTVSVVWSCSSTSLNAGSSTNCKITVTDTNSGTKNDPDGVVNFSTASPTALAGSVRFSVSSCTLADDGSNKTACTIRVRPLGNGSPVMTASYVASDDHQDKSATRSLTVSSNNNPVIAPAATYSTTAGVIGATFDITMVSCTAGDAPEFGLFVSETGDPESVNDEYRPWRSAVSSWGSAVWTPTIPADNALSSFRVRYYCADGTPADADDDKIDWSSSLYTFTVSANAVTPALKAAVSTGTPVTASTLSSAVGTWSVDPDSLPGTDTLGIPGAQAAALKTRVDGIAGPSGQVTRLATAALGRQADRAFMDKWVPVVATKGSYSLERTLEATPEFFGTFAFATPDLFIQRAYERVHGRWPTTAERAAAQQVLRTGSVTRIAFLRSLVEAPERRAATANRDYVAATYQALTKVVPSANDLGRFTALLDDVIVRVSVVEEVALSRAAAAQWVTALASPTGSTVRF